MDYQKRFLPRISDDRFPGWGSTFWSAMSRRGGFLSSVFEMSAHRQSRDFAIMSYHGEVFQLHADGTFGSHPLLSLLPRSGPRGAGLEIRLYETDPDAAAARAGAFADALVLQAPADKPHGLRECVILCPNGYAWVPSRRI